MFCNIDQRSNLFHADIEYAKIVLIYCLIVRLFFYVLVISMRANCLNK